MEIGINFNDIKSYTENMSKGLSDKMFFLDKIKFNSKDTYVFVDFGCADGVLISALHDILEPKGVKAFYVGYDISEEMINLAKTKCDFSTNCAVFTTDWNEVEKHIADDKLKKVLILSSVIHEIYSYARPDSNDLGIFWHRVRFSGFDYICVRDMMCSKDINRKPSEQMIYNTVASEGGMKYKFEPRLQQQKIDFEKRWGAISENNKNLVHFLLKYRWFINWEREVNENYFPIYVEELLEIMEKNYNLAYFERFRVPFLDDCFMRDFGIVLEDYTHIKAVFEMKKVKEG